MLYVDYSREDWRVNRYVIYWYMDRRGGKNRVDSTNHFDDLDRAVECFMRIWQNCRLFENTRVEIGLYDVKDREMIAYAKP